MPTFCEQIAANNRNGLYVSVGLDVDPLKIPACLQKVTTYQSDMVMSFTRRIITATLPHANAYKPNLAFFLAMENGFEILQDIVGFIHESVDHVPVIVDAKVGDIGNTSEKWAEVLFDRLGADAITVSPYLGQDGMEPFLARKEKGVFVLTRTSNVKSDEFQRRLTEWYLGELPGVIQPVPKPLYELVAFRAAHYWNYNANCGAVAGATHADDIGVVREIVGPEFPILVPGIGPQEGDLEKSVMNAAGPIGAGVFMIHASRSVMYASSGEDYAEAAGKAAEALADQIVKIISSM